MLFSTMYGYQRKWARDAGDDAFSLVNKKESINIAQDMFNSEAPCIRDAMHVTISPTFSATPTWQRKPASIDARCYKDANRGDGVLEYYIEDASAQNEMSLLITGISRVDASGAADPGPEWNRTLIFITDAELDDYDLREQTQTHSNSVILLLPNRFQLWPHPSTSDNSTIQIDFRRPTTALSADTDESMIPDEYHMAITHGAMADLFERRGMYDEASSHWGHFRNAIANAKIKYKTRNAEPQTRIRTRFW